MRWTLAAAVAWLGLVGCGGGGGKHGPHDDCSGPGTCAAGSYCAVTADGSVCWEDVEAPSIAGVTLECSTSPCRRDAQLTVAARVADAASMASGAVWAELDLEPGRRWEMTETSPGAYVAEISLEEVAFPHFTRTVGVTFYAEDEAQNPAGPSAPETVVVTRERWTRTLKSASALSLSSPALLPDGRLALGGSDGRLYLVDGEGDSHTAVSVASDQFSGPPSVGSDAIWLASQDGKLHKTTLDGSIVPLVDCAASSPFLGPPAVFGSRAMASTSGVEVFLAKPSNSCAVHNFVEPATSPASIADSGVVFVGTGTKLRGLLVAENNGISEMWTGTPAAPTVGDQVRNAPVGGLGSALWTLARNGAVNRTDTSTASSSNVATVTSVSAGAIVLADDSLLVSDALGQVKRISAGGAPPWPASEALQGSPAVGLALAAATPSVLVPTSSGDVYLLRQEDLATVWSLKLSTQALQPANVAPNPGGLTSTAYVAGADGKLYAFIVDGVLDASAPWPKAFHDTRNTSNAGEGP